MAFTRAHARVVITPESNSSDWFVTHVQPHEGMLRAWLRSRFPSQSDVDDIEQEAYARRLEARKTTEIEAP